MEKNKLLIKKKSFILFLIISILFSCKGIIIDSIPTGATVKYLGEEYFTPVKLKREKNKKYIRVTHEGYKDERIDIYNYPDNKIIIKLEKNQYLVRFKYIYSDVISYAEVKLDNKLFDPYQEVTLEHGSHNFYIYFPIYQKSINYPFVVNKAGQYEINYKESYNEMKYVNEKEFKRKILEGLSNELLTMSYWNIQGDYSIRYYFDQNDGFYNINGKKIGEYKIVDNELVLHIFSNKKTSIYSFYHDPESWFIDDYLISKIDNDDLLYPVSDWIRDGEIRQISGYDVLVLESEYVVLEDTPIYKVPDSNTSRIIYDFPVTDENDKFKLEKYEHLKKGAEISVMGIHNNDIENIKKWAFGFLSIPSIDGRRVYGWCDFSVLEKN